MRQQGFSLVEALIAMSVFSIVLAGVVPAFVFNAATNLKSQRRTEAVAVAQTSLDALRQRGFTEWPLSGTTREVRYNGSSYHVTTLFCTDGLSYCSSSSSSGARHTRVEVSYHGKLLYQAENVYTQLEATD